jgi:hypothetical protein
VTAPLIELNPESIQLLADKLYSLGISNITTIGPEERAEFVTASRALRRLLAAYERAAGRPLHTILLAGVC